MNKEVNSKQQIANSKNNAPIHYSLFTIHLNAGFTLIETLVAVSLLSVAIVAPMSLTTKSLAAAYYARDQIVAFHLAQEAVETVRHFRDNNILQTALGNPTDILAGIPLGIPFTVNTIDDSIDSAACNSGTCPPLQLDPTQTFYGYGNGWTDTRFTRTVEVETVADNGGVPQEIRVTVTVSWRTGSFQTREVRIRQNLYRWVNDAT